MPSVANSHKANHEFSKEPGFVSWFVRELRRKAVSVCRIHVAGDFYDEEYVNKFIAIVSASSNVQFYAYTRSWRRPEILPALKWLGSLPNMHLWWSVDRETGMAPLDSNVRVAYMAINDIDAASAPAGCDLMFRDNPKTVMKSAAGAIVCPVENGVEHASGFQHTCSTCKLCFTRKQPKAMQQLREAHVLEIRSTRLVVPRKKKRKLARYGKI